MGADLRLLLKTVFATSMVCTSYTPRIRLFGCPGTVHVRGEGTGVISRRTALRGVAGGAAAITVGGVLAGCSGGSNEPADAKASVAPRKGGKLRAASSTT